MALTLVTHSNASPALFGALAASVAHMDDALLMHCAVAFRPEHGADTVQMVAAAGALVPSGLLWYERLTANNVLPVSSVDQIVEMATQRAVVVPWHPEYQNAALRAELLDKADRAGVAVVHLQGRRLQDRWDLQTAQQQPSQYGTWTRDAFGRWGRSQDGLQSPLGTPTLTVVLIGTQSDQTDIYPATLAALGDAAQATQIDLRVRFVAPQHLQPSELAEAAGIVLPGGSDMRNVPGQIEAARHGLRTMTPTLGLCLGMQSMTTALAQSCPGLEQVNMAEAAPDAPSKSFTPMAGTPGLPTHRLGSHTLSFANSALERQFGEHREIRCNHRFMLDPALIEPLRIVGLEITATDLSGHIVDAIDWPQHPFYKGMQGHPELGSRSDNAHPLIEAFLLSALAKDSMRRQVAGP